MALYSFMSISLRADPSVTVLWSAGGGRREWMGGKQKLFKNSTEKLHTSLHSCGVACAVGQKGAIWSHLAACKAGLQLVDTYLKS